MNQKGFSQIILLFIALVLAAAAGVGGVLIYQQSVRKPELAPVGSIPLQPSSAPQAETPQAGAPQTGSSSAVSDKASTIKPTIPTVLLQPKSECKLDLTDKGMRSASIKIDQNKMYLDSYYSDLLLEFDPSSCQIKKEYKIGKQIMTSNLTENIYYYNDGDYKNSNIHALDISTGIEKWGKKFENPEQKYAYLNVGQSKVYLNSGPAKVVALKSENGEKLWTFENKLSADTLIDEPPLIRINDSTVVLGFDGGMVYALNSELGEERWQFNSGSVTRPNEILVSNNLVFVASYRTTGDIVFALDKDTGQVKWQFSTEGNPNTSLASDGNVLYVAKANGYLYAVNGKDGKELWRFRTYHFPSNIVISGDRIYFGETEYADPFPTRGHIYSLDRKSGKQIWHYKMKDSISSVEAFNGIGYFFLSNGELIARK